LAEKSQKIQSLGELKNKRRIKDAELGKFQKTVTTSTHKWFREENLASIIENMGNANFTKMVDEFKTIGSERQDIALYANELKSLVTRAYQELNARYKVPQNPPPSIAEMRSDGIRIESTNDEEIFELVAANIFRANLDDRSRPEPTAIKESAVPTLPGEDVAGLDPSTPKIVYERHDSAIKERDRLKEELGVIDGEIVLLESQLPALGQPKRLFLGLIILTYFSAVGIVYPLYLMSSNPVGVTSAQRSLVLYGFVSGLLILIVFILRAVADLKGHELERKMNSNLKP
jgi:hypothetical protein